MNLIDVHAHLDKKFFGDDVAEVIERAKLAGVKVIIACGVDHQTNREVLLLSEKYPLIRPALGVYPPDALEKETDGKRGWDIDEEIGFIESKVKDLIAISEIGLDYKDGEDKKLQKDVFSRLVKIAMKNDLPVIIHSRKAEADVIEMLEELKAKKVVMHCFGGKLKLARRIRDNKWWFSIPTNSVRSEHFQKIIAETPLRQLLTETDSPFLTPFPGQRNEPANVIETIKVMAKIKQLELNETADRVFMNYQELFL